jgi:hypothetical protein
MNFSSSGSRPASLAIAVGLLIAIGVVFLNKPIEPVRVNKVPTSSPPKLFGKSDKMLLSDLAQALDGAEIVQDQVISRELLGKVFPYRTTSRIFLERVDRFGLAFQVRSKVQEIGDMFFDGPDQTFTLAWPEVTAVSWERAPDKKLISRGMPGFVIQRWHKYTLAVYLKRARIFFIPGHSKTEVTGFSLEMDDGERGARISDLLRAAQYRFGPLPEPI